MMLIDTIALSLIAFFMILGFVKRFVGLLLFCFYVVIWVLGTNIIMLFYDEYLMFSFPIINYLLKTTLVMALILFTTIIDPILNQITYNFPFNKSLGVILGFAIGLLLTLVTYQSFIIYYQYNDILPWKLIIKAQPLLLPVELTESYTHLYLIKYQPYLAEITLKYFLSKQ